MRGVVFIPAPAAEMESKKPSGRALKCAAIGGYSVV
jgi:hypothetical protein